MTDYRIKIFLKNGQVRQTTYENLIQTLGIKDHDALSISLWWTKIDKIRYLVETLKEKYPEMESVTIFDEEGKEVWKS